MTVAILYDRHVHAWPLIRYVVWCGIPAEADMLVTDDEAHTVIAEVIQKNPRIPWGRLELVDTVRPDAYDELIVLRSHPEMFGAEIREARAADRPVQLITVERIPDGPCWICDPANEETAND